MHTDYRRIFALTILVSTALTILVSTALTAAELSTGRYAVILNDPPVAQQMAAAGSGRAPQAAGARSYRERVLAAQSTLRQELTRRNLRVTGSAQTVLNAVFIAAMPEQAQQLRGVAGVKAVIPLRRFHMQLDRAVQLENVPAAWNQLGGVQGAGAGVKIAIIDTGIDQTHPAFQDPSLTAPAGYPVCNGSDCAFTSNKVIVARSYVPALAAGSQPNPAADSRPDDVSPRDHVGHGTALAMIAAGGTNTGPADTITGFAPKAFLGSYKVFGSPGVNDFTFGDVIIAALEDAMNDHMDIAVLSLGGPALFGPNDQGAICGAPDGTPCDAEAVAIENAVQGGMNVAAAAGNSGDSGGFVPTLNTIESPATAPSAIAVAASVNSHIFVSSVQVRNQGAPESLQFIAAVFGDGPLPAGAVTAPLADVAALDGSGVACSPLPSGSLNGNFALILRSPQACTFATKVANAQNAGAVGVIFLQASGQSGVVTPGGLLATQIPAVMISNSDGVALQSFLASHPGLQATLDPTLRPIDASSFNTVADFSSHGPAIDAGFKPDIAAVGTDVYMAAQKFDPNGVMYDPTGYTVASGTSFSAPMAAGTLALLKQQFPNYSALQLRSALINTAAQVVTEGGSPASVVSAGNGEISAGDAVQALVTVSPATISFGALASGNPPRPQTLTIHYGGTGSATLTLAAAPVSGTAPSLSSTSVTVSSGQDQTVTLTLPSSIPSPGIYEGGITIRGAGAALRVPYLYLAGDGFPFDIIPLVGTGFDGTAGQPVPTGGFAFKIVDQFGVPVAGVPVSFLTTRGGGRITGADPRTDANGVATAGAVLGPSVGTQSFLGRGGGLSLPFTGLARPLPTISPNGAVNAASFTLGPGVSPGSYIALFGSGLSDFADGAATAALPLSIDDVSVSFDAPAANLSLPGRLIYVSPGQVNVQVPFELQGQTSVLIKVTVVDSPGQVVTVPVSTYSPAVYQVPDSQGSLLVAAALNLANAPINSGRPAVRGQYVQLYLNGLGPVSNAPAIGFVAQSQPLSTTPVTPSVTIGGATVNTIQYSGLTPGTDGLYQINLIVPPNAPAGMQPLVVTIGGVSSPPVNIPVQ